VARTSGTLERPRDGADRDHGVEARWIDLVDAWREDEIDALLLADREVAGLVSRYCWKSAASLNWRG